MPCSDGTEHIDPRDYEHAQAGMEFLCKILNSKADIGLLGLSGNDLKKLDKWFAEHQWRDIQRDVSFRIASKFGKFASNEKYSAYCAEIDAEEKRFKPKKIL